MTQEVNVTTQLLGLPIYITAYILFQSLYHASLFAVMKETKKNIHSKIWDNILYGNYWGTVLAISLALLLYRFFLIGINPLFIIIVIFLDLLSHILTLLTTYYLALPILKSINIFKKEYIPAFVGFPTLMFISIKLLIRISVPKSNINIIFPYIIITLLIFFYIFYLLKNFSGRYSGMGFIYKPFLIGSLGILSFTSSILMVVFILIKMPTLKLIDELYYNVFFYSVFSIITVIQFIRFVVDYPSAIQPKLKAYLPFDPNQVTTTITAVFFAISLFYTVKDAGFLFSFPFGALFVVGVLFGPIAALFIYSETFAGETMLGYWNYVTSEIKAHLALTFYVLSTTAIIWNSVGSNEQVLFGIFFGFSFLFYLTTTLDIRKLTLDLKIKSRFNIITLIKHGIDMVSVFLIIFFLVIITRGKTTNLDTFFSENPYFPVALIGIFFMFYFAFLRHTHKGFEELMERGLITTISYFAGLLVFVVLFILYLRINSSATFMQFPLFGMVFFGYFIILITDVYSTTTLKIKEYKVKNDITDLLNHVAGHFFRTDILEEKWEKVIDCYKDEDPELEKARFYPPDRTFDLEGVNEKTKVTAAVAMLYKLDRIAKSKDAPVVPFEDDIKQNIAAILGEKLLLLPEELSKGFNLNAYYPKLLEGTFNRINEDIRPFVPLEDYSKVLIKLSKVDQFFNNISYDNERMMIKSGIVLTRKEFLKYLKLYVQALEETFPFNRLLLRNTIASEVENKLSLYGFSQADVLNVVPTGIKEIDEVLYGGLIKGTSTLFLSEERRVKNDVLFRFIVEGLNEKEVGIFATSRVASKNLLELLKRAVPSTEKLEIIDLHLSAHTNSVVSTPIIKENRQIISTSLIHVKQALVSVVKKFPKEAHKRMVLDIYSDIAKYQKPDEIIELIIKQTKGFSRWNGTSIIVLSPSLSNEELERHFDNVFLLTDVATIKIKKLFGGRPKKEEFTIWGNYSPVEDPGYSPFLES